jgi:hypothetical protein
LDRSGLSGTECKIAPVIGIFEPSRAIQVPVPCATNQWSDAAEIDVADRLAPQAIRSVVGRTGGVSLARDGEGKQPGVGRRERIFPPSLG